jgi:prepilin-type N-terminal cleavage/methylation domain-containing protein
MKRNRMGRIKNPKAFTVVELMVTLVVTGIILSAVATLAFALSSATRAGDAAAVTQAQLRQTTLRILDLVQNARMILTASPTELAVWRSDDNEDSRINVDELVFLQSSASHEGLTLVQFSPDDHPEMTFDSDGLSPTKLTLIGAYPSQQLSLLPGSTDVQFAWDAAAPLTRRITISLKLTEDGTAREYEISATLRAWAGHLLNDSHDGLVTEDDDE